MAKMTLQQLNETRPEEIQLDPVESRWWNLRLEWLMTYEPKRTAELFLKSRRKLYQNLKLAVQRAVLYQARLQHNQDLSPDQIEEIVTSAVGPIDGEIQPRLSEDLEMRIRQWAQNPPENN
jgi:hypothetical protein